MRQRQIEKMINDVMLEVTARREADEKVYLRKVNEIEKRFENLENAVADAMIMIGKQFRQTTNAAIADVKKEMDALKETLKEATKPTLSKMTMKDEGGSIYNEIIDEWLNGKKEDDE